jgi:hypothetical protein
VEAEVFEEQDLARLEGLAGGLGFGAPTQAATNFTGLPRSFCELGGDRARRENLLDDLAVADGRGGTSAPGRRRLRAANLIVGRAAAMRWVFVMAPVFLSWGTLKSTRTRTRLALDGAEFAEGRSRHGA